MAETVGFIGLGRMGHGMAANLSRSFSVMGFDVDAGRFAGLEKVTRVDSVAAIARGCTCVCLSLPGANVVEDVCLGREGLAGRMPRGALVIDMSTSLPSVSRRVAARLAGDGVAFADAPVSGGEAGARDAALAIMVGAPRDTYDRCLPILSAMGRSVVHVGEVGAGGVAKLVNNMIVGAAFAVIAEGFALAERSGIEAGVLYDAIKDGWAGSKVLDVSAAAVAARSYPPGGTVDMLVKDLDYARTLAAEAHVPIPMSALAHEVFVAGQAAGHGKESQPSVIELWRAASG